MSLNHYINSCKRNLEILLQGKNLFHLFSVTCLYDEHSHVHLMPGFSLSFSSYAGLCIQWSYEIQHYCYSSSSMGPELKNVSLDLCWTLYIALLTVSPLQSFFSC